MPIKAFRKPGAHDPGESEFAAGGHEPFDHKGKKQWQLCIVLGPFDMARK